jgi:hypothetical protein
MNSLSNPSYIPHLFLSHYDIPQIDTLKMADVVTHRRMM